jgi:predicted RNase H-like HicB family nuclease
MGYIVPMSPQERVRTVNAQYVCTFRPEPEGGYTILCAAFPEIVSYGATLEQARNNAREAIKLCVEVYRERGDALPPFDEDPQETIRELVPVKLA